MMPRNIPVSASLRPAGMHHCRPFRRPRRPAAQSAGRNSAPTRSGCKASSHLALNSARTVPFVLSGLEQRVQLFLSEFDSASFSSFPNFFDVFEPGPAKVLAQRRAPPERAFPSRKHLVECLTGYFLSHAPLDDPLAAFLDDRLDQHLAGRKL